MKKLTVIAFAALLALPALAADAVGLGAEFGPNGWGYLVDYPKDWIKTEPSNFAVVFSGREGTAGFSTTVSIQNVRTPENDRQAAVSGEMARLEGRMRDQTAGLEILTRQPFVYEKNGMKLVGGQMVAEFSRKGEEFRQWIIVLPRQNTPILHVWIYTGPVEDFPQTLPTAKAMLDSWVIKAD